jgi:DNA-binding Xre family transcriptional regulator
MQQTQKTAKRAVRKGKNPCLARLIQWGMDRRNLNAYALSTRAGLNPSILSRILTGQRVAIAPKTAERIGYVLGIKWADILEAARQSRALNALGVVASAEA